MVSHPVIVVGAGGHARVVADALRTAGVTVLGYTDADPATHGRQIDGLPVLGNDDVLAGRMHEIELANGLGSVGMPTRRRALYEQLRAQGFRFVRVIHPRACVATSAQLGDGTQIMAGAVVQAGAVIGDNSLINSGAIVDHDCRIGSHCHVASGAVLSGDVHLGEGCHIGTGAALIQGLRIGAHTVVGAGATVVAHHPGGGLLLGTPARVKT